MTSKAEGYLRLPVWSDGGVIKPLVDDNGRIPVQLEGIDVTMDVNLESSDITLNVSEQSPLASIQAQGYGYIDSAWEKLPMVFGFTDRWVVQLSDLNAGAGTNVLTTTAVAAGFIHRVDMVGAVNVNNAASIEQYATGAGIGVTFIPSTAMGANVWKITFPVGIWLKEGDTLSTAFYGCLAGDDIYFRIWGVKMAVG